MKISLLLTVFFTATLVYANAPSQNQKKSQAIKSYSFQFKAPKTKPFSIVQTALTKELAFKSAASECFKKLTGNRYPGEEKGLEIIDICANPKM